MELRSLGRLGRVRALTLGGGGIGGVWGSTDRAEAVATVHAALDAGITMLDLAPSYGTSFVSEVAVAEALRRRPSDVMITSKVQLPDDDGRVVAAGSLTGALDLTVPADHPAAVDFARAAPFRALAASLGETPAALAHRYALSVPGVATVVLGVKNRTELAECVAAEARGPLSADELKAVTALTD